jgi:hypothetical protein
LRLAVRAVGGLSLALAGGCRAGRSPLDKWDRLGGVWHRFRAFEGGKVRVWRRLSFKRLRKEMRAALDDLPAWVELRGVFEQRAGCIELCLRVKEAALAGITCYALSIQGPRAAARDARKQVEELMALVAQGSLTEAAARKAAAEIARQAQYIPLAQRASEIPDDRLRREREGELGARRRAGEIEPSPAAELAGYRLTELTVGKLGWLAGPPTQDEGQPTRTPSG